MSCSLEKSDNQRLDYVLSDYQEKLDSIDHQERFSCTQIKEMLENKRDDDSSITIKEFMERRISDFRKEGRNSYADMNTTQGTRSISFTMPEEAKEIAARCIRNI